LSTQEEEVLIVFAHHSFLHTFTGKELENCEVKVVFLDVEID
jgi:hypothetical protein